MTTIRTEHDPICHMDIDPATAAGQSEHDGHTFYFCSRGCKLDFDEDPAAALKAEAEYDHSQSAHQMMTMREEAPPPKKPWWRFWP
ncbi:MAG TPA: YHS domain-containing protein [Dehalococcoidia bacterium]|nr:YHS domain-containing protein [Dehalococcoidia bacterium]